MQYQKVLLTMTQTINITETVIMALLSYLSSPIITVLCDWQLMNEATEKQRRASVLFVQGNKQTPGSDS